MTPQPGPGASPKPFAGRKIHFIGAGGCGMSGLAEFVLAEGAAMMVLEDATYALERNAPILAEIVGYSNTGDAFHLTQPSPEPLTQLYRTPNPTRLNPLQLDRV